MRTRLLGLPYTLNIRGKLWELEDPMVMGILNVTPDSFYASGRSCADMEIARRAKQIVQEGGRFIDVGACSTRPGAVPVSAEEELERLSRALPIIREVAPDAVLSVDTFRSEVSRECVERWGCDMINDISGGMMDDRMFETIAELKVPYILTHMRGTPSTMQQMTDYPEGVLTEVVRSLSGSIERLHLLGVHDIIVDPGFGFAKTLDQNYSLFASLSDFSLLDCPLLVGISRKSMIYKLLDSDADHALTGTIVLNTLALQSGADILRVHDVKAAVDAIRLCQKVKWANL